MRSAFARFARTTAIITALASAGAALAQQPLTPLDGSAYRALGPEQRFASDLSAHANTLREESIGADGQPTELYYEYEKRLNDGPRVLADYAYVVDANGARESLGCAIWGPGYSVNYLDNDLSTPGPDYVAMFEGDLPPIFGTADGAQRNAPGFEMCIKLVTPGLLATKPVPVGQPPSALK